MKMFSKAFSDRLAFYLEGWKSNQKFEERYGERYTSYGTNIFVDKTIIQ